MTQENDDRIFDYLDLMAGEDFAEDLDDFPENFDFSVDASVDEDRSIDQIHCKDCGRPMVIWVDVTLREGDKICGRCKRGLAPEWEY